jgi:amino acid transporter
MATAEAQGTPSTSGTPGSPDSESNRLHRGALGLVDISASTMANIGPAYSFYFGFGFLAITAGVAAPLVFVVAGIAILLLGNTIAQFSRVLPSTGGFITFVGKAFGPRSAVVTALLAGAGYMIAVSSVLAVSGGFLSITVEKYFHWNVPWGIFSVLITIGAVATMIRGVGVSTKLAGFFFGFEMLILVVVSIAALIKNGGHLNLTPFEPSHINGGLKGLAAAFPLAIYSFIGWENSASLAEETDNPRRNVPRAVFLSVSLMAVGYLLFSYATVSGFNYNVDKLGASQIPFIDVADNVLSAFAVLAYIAGLTSTVGVLISAANSQARLVFNAGREGLLPAWIGRVHPKRRTPMNAIFLYIAVASTIIIVWAIWHVSTGRSGSMDPITFFAESSTMGTILVLVVYLLANLALPVYFRKHRPDEFDVVKHAVLPLLGVVAIAVPMYYLAKPGQDAPYSWFPWIGLVIVILAIVYAAVLVKRDPTIGDRVGSLLADE